MWTPVFFRRLLGMAFVLGLFSGLIAVTATAIGENDPSYVLQDAGVPRQPGKVTFGVISDTHIGPDGQSERLNAVISWYNKRGVDALAIVGDLTDNGTQEQYDELKTCFDTIDDKIKLVASMGNHEGDTADRFIGMYGHRPNVHQVINGYHFITLSPGSGAFDPETGKGTTHGGDKYGYVAQWTEAQIQEAIAKDPAKPVFVFFHHPLQNTFYVSDEWYGSGLGDAAMTFFSKYPQVVTFSGHIHTPNNDPRSIWQDGGFTAVNTVTLYYYEMEKGYIGNQPHFNDVSTYPVPGGGAAQGLVVEAEGPVVSITNYDFKADQWVKQTWTFDVTKPLPYTKARAERAIAPVFREGAPIVLSALTPDSLTVTFDQAIIPGDNEVQDAIHSYRFELYNAETGACIAASKQWSDYMHTVTRPTYSQTIDGLGADIAYELRIVAITSFGKISDDSLRVFFKLGIGAAEP